MSCRCVEYECQHDGCEHIDIRTITCENLPHVVQIPATVIGLPGVCGVCISERDRCNSLDLTADASRLANFARAFYLLKSELDAAGVSTKVEGTVPDEYNIILRKVLQLLSADIIWRGKPDQATDLPTSGERAIVAELSQNLFTCEIGDLAVDARCVARWLELHIQPTTTSSNNQECDICYETYGDMDDDGKVISPVKYSCDHGGICHSCAAKSIMNDNGHLGGAQCHYRCHLRPIHQSEISAFGEGESFAYMEELEGLMAEYYEDINAYRRNVQQRAELADDPDDDYENWAD